tara:strand:- start:1014 stop:1292 length:279 start_codon:yes stop_codon:yes gene_type:complete
LTFQILSGLFLILLIISLRYLYKFSRIILNVEDAVEESLDIIDQSYQQIGDILNKPLFYDSSEVRAVIGELNNSRNALLYIANQLSDISDKE